MCGIAGIGRASGARVTPDEIRRMTDAIVHRGPDGGDCAVFTGAGLGIRRLRVIDLVTGDQPIANEDSSVWTVFNGEIYNFRALREDLLSRGHRFRTVSDTECLVHAYEEFGTAMLPRLAGMFAFAIHDISRGRLVLARDRLGKKPLLYAHVGGDLYFASEFSAFAGITAISRDVDPGALGDYLAYGFVPGPATIYRSIRKLPPAHFLTWEKGEVRVQPYWSLRYEPKRRLTEAEALEELEARLRAAVRARLVSDVPLGALLSGGVDSSTVVALMAQQTDRPVKTFSIGFDDAAFDELAHARRVAERYGTDHHEFIVRPNAATVLPLLVRHYGEPYADSSAIPTYYVSQLARTHVTVALNGDGGDEAFSGYDRSRAMWLAHLGTLVPGTRLLIRSLNRPLTALPISRSRFLERGRRFLAAAWLPPEQRYARWLATIPIDLMQRLVTPLWQAEFARARSFAVERAFERSEGLDTVDRVLATDVATYLPDDLLVKMDIASMANSLETRSPLLDHQVVEFAATLPVHFKLRHGYRQKYLLKQLARHLIPAENIDRPKMGFGVPVGSWLRSDLRDMAAEALLGEAARRRGYFVPNEVRRLWDEHQSGSRDHRSPLWTMLMLELWHREFVDRSAAL